MMCRAAVPRERQSTCYGCEYLHSHICLVDQISEAPQFIIYMKYVKGIEGGYESQLVRGRGPLIHCCKAEKTPIISYCD